MKCKNCENVLAESDQFCTKCGFSVEKKEGAPLLKNTPKDSKKFGHAILNFLQFNWFKLCIVILLATFVLLFALSDGIKIKVKHSGYIDLEMSGDVNTNIDGATLYLE